MAMDYFALFGLEPAIFIDSERLTERFYALAKEAQSSLLESSNPHFKRLASQMAANINDGYRILRYPLSRAQYLANYYNIALDVSPSQDFLEQCMDWQEALEADTNTEHGLALVSDFQKLSDSLYDELDHAFRLYVELAEPEGSSVIAITIAKINYIHQLMTRLNARIDTPQ